VFNGGSWRYNAVQELHIEEELDTMGVLPNKRAESQSTIFGNYKNENLTLSMRGTHLEHDLVLYCKNRKAAKKRKMRKLLQFMYH